jgi:anti-sigma regulatory factor (Ser/Thr protein kinase)
VVEQAGVRTHGPGPLSSRSEWSAELTSVAQATGIRRAFRDYLLRHATPESDVPAAELIFGELLGNVVRHAWGCASFRLSWHDLRATLVVTDRGPGFQQRPRPSAHAEPSAERGRGLKLVRAFAVKLNVRNNREGGASVSVILPVLRLQPAP